ncbi:MAG: epoxyqueuosine reductase QueH [Desulfuromonadales bacterium]|nr:epoxyqueuosine reductase QueH [Desulfuromonadales bacterium]NIR33484.1 epoxyqueuosine reductase QueH [Desulfuromonadales bacterium]NIS41052.1 epoxyqueuosine reductase QueH [Desulfuromonadales bacterium]
MNTLIHICCGNCAIYPVKMLRQQGHNLTGFFFNNNIHPYREFSRRLETAQEYAERVSLPLIVDDRYLLEDFLAQVSLSPQNRCDFCYRSRMEETARRALEEGFDGFTTSLLYSRYQQHDKIRDFGEELARSYGVAFIYEDFRAGWREGIDISKAMGLYRQQYCGCIYSEKDRYCPKERR